MKNILVQSNITIRQAMKTLDKTAEKCLLIVNSDKHLLGTLTDGDIRRSILSGYSFSQDISKSYNTNPTILYENKFSKENAKKILIDKQLDLLPVVDQNKIVIDYITLSSISSDNNHIDSLHEIEVVIMAGGKGTRMAPFTNVLPKPLVPVHEKPIIEHIIDRFTNVGCRKFHLSVNYKAKILKAYFEELQPEYKINFVYEEIPLGTAGSLDLLNKKITGTFFVTNCDIIIKCDYNSLFKFHKEGGFDITLVASTKEYIIPYGTCELDKNGYLSHINEKPSYDFLINTGLYVLNDDVLDLIPKNKFYHITHLIEDAKNKGKKIGVYPVDDDAWIDIGQWTEYRKAIEML